jgi:hypothetical protein
MKKVDCKKCVNFEGEESEFIDIGGKQKTQWLVTCAEYGEVKVIGGGNQIWKSCPLHKKSVELKEVREPKIKAKKVKSCALKVWKKKNDKTAADIAEMLGISVRQANRYITGEAMPPRHAVIASRRTGIPREEFIFTPKVMEGLK